MAGDGPRHRRARRTAVRRPGASRPARSVSFSLAIAHSTIPYLPWEVIAGILAGATVLGLGATELSTRNTLRRDPAAVLQAL